MSTDHNEYQQHYFQRERGGNVRLHQTRSPYTERHLERTMAVGDLRPGLSILEVGAGLGRFSALMLERGLDLVASDLSPTLLAELRATHPELDTITADVATIATQTTKRFDRVVGFFMLHHLENFDAVFAGLRDVLAPGGRVVFCEPNAYCGLYYLQIALSRQMTWRGDGGVRHMRPSVICRAMERVGFVDVAAERYGFLPPFLYNHAPGRTLDRGLEAIPLLEPVRAFQIFSGKLPSPRP